MSTKMQEQQVTVDPMVKWLQRLEKEGDRGTLAELRRGIALDRDQLYLLYRVVPPGLLDRRGDPPERIFMLASLFALHPLPFREGYPPAPRRNIGDSLREFALRRRRAKAQHEGKNPLERQEVAEGGALLPEALKRRFDAALASRSDEVFEHLRHMVRLLKGEEIPIDWDQLLRDLRSWDHPSRFVQRSWSRSFYVGREDHTRGGEGHVD